MQKIRPSENDRRESHGPVRPLERPLSHRIEYRYLVGNAVAELSRKVSLVGQDYDRRRSARSGKTESLLATYRRTLAAGAGLGERSLWLAPNRGPWSTFAIGSSTTNCRPASAPEFRRSTSSPNRSSPTRRRNPSDRRAHETARHRAIARRSRRAVSSSTSPRSPPTRRASST